MPSCYTPSRKNLPHCVDQISLEGLGPEPSVWFLIAFLIVLVGGAILVGYLAGAWAYRTWPFESKEGE